MQKQIIARSKIRTYDSHCRKDVKPNLPIHPVTAFRMNPIDLIKRDLGPDGWARCSDAWAEDSIIKFQDELSLFRDHKIYLVRGQTHQFDFVMLPHCSYGYYAANGRHAVRLTRAGKEIERLLAADWATLPAKNPVRLASFVLQFYDGGITASHHVVADANEIVAMSTCRSPYWVDESTFATALPRIGATSCTIEGDTVTLRAITLCGWMHRKHNLGIETLTISKAGIVDPKPREVLAERMFDTIPRLMV